MAYLSRFDHAKLGDVALAFARTAESLVLDEARARVEPHLERYRLGLLRLLMVGEIKKGKSSLINALLGCPELVPTGIDVATSTVFKVMHGPERRYRVFFQPKDPDQPGSPRLAPIDISAEQVRLYGTEAGNPNNDKGVDFIGIEHPHPLLKAGLVITDLPGLGGLFREHSLLTMRYLPKADAVLFVLDSVEQVLGRAEIATLERLRGTTPRIAFVQTKTDLVGEDQWRTWRERNLEIIEQKLGLKRAEVPYFAVSNELKRLADEHQSLRDLEDSGFPELLRYLNEDLLPQKQDALAAPVVAALEAALLAARQPLDDEVSVVSTDGREGLERLEANTKAAQAEYECWKVRELARLMQEFDDAYDRAYDDAVARVTRDLDPSPYGSVVGPVLAEIERAEFSAHGLAEEAERYADRMVDLCGRRMEEISRAFDAGIGDAYGGAAVRVGKALRPPQASAGSPTVSLERSSLAISPRGGLYEQARAGFYGMSAGGAIAGLLASVFFPPLGLGVAVASLLGGLFGGARSIRERREQERQGVLAQLRNILCDIVRRLQQEARRHLEVTAKQTRKKMTRALREAVEQRDRELKAVLAEIEQQKRRSREETSRRLKELKDKLGLIEAVLRLLHTAVPMAKAA